MFLFVAVYVYSLVLGVHCGVGFPLFLLFFLLFPTLHIKFAPYAFSLEVRGVSPQFENKDPLMFPPSVFSVFYFRMFV